MRVYCAGKCHQDMVNTLEKFFASNTSKKVLQFHCLYKPSTYFCWIWQNDALCGSVRLQSQMKICTNMNISYTKTKLQNSLLHFHNIIKPVTYRHHYSCKERGILALFHNHRKTRLLVAKWSKCVISEQKEQKFALPSCIYWLNFGAESAFGKI